ncbi:5-deoxyglucuronate isomerase [Salana multivorans]|uniref:5-deoxyglucuronate isomerase n=1 Tax=Salana multivorans TaxID=120377 RepID=A0A3N2DAA7_9MICO|nr:5-deoxy-glucuronate isomerase [Salana multivorans]ROR96721.1 5-deoxyglucuronate isomerase [Salana multivorans]
MTTYHHPAGSMARPDVPGAAVWLDPGAAGWSRTGLRVLELSPDVPVTLDLPGTEAVVLPLAGSVTVGVAGVEHPLAGRASVFDGPSDALYVPPGHAPVLTGTGRVAVLTCRSDAIGEVQVVAPGDVAIEVRGRGAVTRLARTYTGGAGLRADRLLGVEVITPGGNWSSYPPHKHDVDTETETQLEEIYYFEIAGGDDVDGWGYCQVTASDERPIDVLAEVRTGDVVLVPHGWHGPAIAPPGFDMYYLNVMAGDGASREWLVSYAPSTGRILDSVSDAAVDPRLAGAG